MGVTLKEVLELVKRLPEKDLAKAKAELEKIKEKSDAEKEKEVPPCPKCKGTKVVKNGKKSGKQSYICRECQKSFVETTGTALFNSHSGESVWKQVIRDTVNGVSLDETAGTLDLHHETVFNMRHKILYCLEQEQTRNPVQLTGVCEADETYILENYKGKKLPDDFWRKPRKHGAKAQKQGLSDEYICVCAGVERGGNAAAVASGRSQPSSADITRVFSGKLSDDALVLCDGAKSYGVLEKECNCTVMNVSNDDSGFKKINEVNGFHGYIKERNRSARGFATKYLNRYNALFSMTYRGTDFIVDDIYNILTDMSNRYNSIADSQSKDLLSI